ncbi:MAG: MBL fold metallo-hydrolase [Candidatus Bathyarchaeota archaeon]|nr:MBL fold metallo-hydrolase [Candidatus Bathyarchaeota archaeon]
MSIPLSFHHIKCPFQQPGYFTTVVVILGESITLIDAGLNSSPREAIFPLLTECHRSPEEIENIILTHAHGDHFEGIPSILEHANASIHVHELEQHRVIDLATRCNFDSSRIESITHGDVLSMSDRQLEIFHCPGHSAGSVCVIDHESQVFVTGDSIQGQGVDRPLLFYSSIAYVNSLDRLSHRPISGAIVGHPFPPRMQPLLDGAAVQELLKVSFDAVNTLKNRVEQVLTNAKRPLSLHDLGRLMPEVRSPSIPTILSELVTHGTIRQLGHDPECLWFAN